MIARVLLAGTVLLLPTQAALACKCMAMSRGAVYASAAVAFAGEVVNITTTPSGRQRTRMRVVRPIKGIGRHHGELIVETVTDSAACGWDFRDGPRRVTIAAQRAAQGHLTASRCALYNLNPQP